MIYQGRNKGGTIPRAPNHYERAEQSQQCHKCFLQYSTFASERPQVRTWGHQTYFLPWEPSNLVMPLGISLVSIDELGRSCSKQLLSLIPAVQCCEVAASSQVETYSICNDIMIPSFLFLPRKINARLSKTS